MLFSGSMLSGIVVFVVIGSVAFATAAPGHDADADSDAVFIDILTRMEAAAAFSGSFSAAVRINSLHMM
jgi:hypothetical protein